MARAYFLLALVIQASLTFAEPSEETPRALLKQLPENEVVKDFPEAQKDWMDMFLGPNSDSVSSPSAAMMAQVTDSTKAPEEQVKDIQDMAKKITMVIQSEMANLIAYALSGCKKTNETTEADDNVLRSKRSVETPMDSTRLINRLLKHIKSNNEYQNIAIEKMMTAQEIAEKYGIKYDPEEEILTDLAVAANEQTKDLASIFEDAAELKNVTRQETEFVPLQGGVSAPETCTIDSGYYVYSTQKPDMQQEAVAQLNAAPQFEFVPENVGNVQPIPITNRQDQQNVRQETQIPQPMPQHPHQHHHHTSHVCPKPNFYEPVPQFTPVDLNPIVEPVTTTTTFVLPMIEEIEMEPELAGEEFEETVSSKMYVDHEEDGSTTLNHVMTYTIGEKAHFRPPQIEKLPQQMQYTFFLV